MIYGPYSDAEWMVMLKLRASLNNWACMDAKRKYVYDKEKALLKQFIHLENRAA